MSNYTKVISAGDVLYLYRPGQEPLRFTVKEVCIVNNNGATWEPFIYWEEQEIPDAWAIVWELFKSGSMWHEGAPELATTLRAIKDKSSLKISVSGKELRERFIGRLEHAGLNPWMFNEGRMDDTDSMYLSKTQCVALGMSEYEFDMRMKNG